MNQLMFSDTNVQDQIMRSLNIVYHDASKLLNRSHIKRWIAEIEKNVTKTNPDFVVLKGCSRYVLFELNRKEWCKYYFFSMPYSPNPPSGSPIRSHVVLSRYPLNTNQSFGNPLIHIVDTTIAFNDIPIKYEYDDPAVQSIDNERLTIIVTDDLLDENVKHETDFQAIIQRICQHPHTVLLFGVSSGNQLRPLDWDSISDNICYLSEGWKFETTNERTGNLEFKLVEFE